MEGTTLTSRCGQLRWPRAVAGGELAAPRGEWCAMGKTVRLFKVGWQGQELIRETLVKVMQQVLQPIGEVQGNLAVYPEAFGNRGVQANEGGGVLGHGGGMYVPILMKDLDVGITEEQKAKMLELWGGVEPEGPKWLRAGSGCLFGGCHPPESMSSSPLESSRPRCPSSVSRHLSRATGTVLLQVPPSMPLVEAAPQVRPTPSLCQL